MGSEAAQKPGLGRRGNNRVAPISQVPVVTQNDGGSSMHVESRHRPNNCPDVPLKIDNLAQSNNDKISFTNRVRELQERR